MKISKFSGSILAAALFTTLAGCSTNTKDTTNLGPMPTTPPAAYAPQKTAMSADAFVAKLQSLPREQRSQFIASNQAVVGQIMSEPDSSPNKQKLTSVLSSH